ncbi:hypothetical protein LXG23DRAFT_33934 [Yarrowia lipolytica]|nr:hypothetical protein LXG23DRAFT_33934 [Yarrowia lipolytica]QNQ00092.1 Hypothetical protein YALI2_E01407g [Yarrowia lipolytica]
MYSRPPQYQGYSANYPSGYNSEVVRMQNLATSRIKFNAGRTFDSLDDVEFCPNLLEEERLNNASPHMLTPDQELRNAISRQYGGSNYSYSSPLSPSPSGSAGVTRAKKALEIIDPATGRASTPTNMDTGSPRKL